MKARLLATPINGSSETSVTMMMPPRRGKQGNLSRLASTGEKPDGLRVSHSIMSELAILMPTTRRVNVKAPPVEPYVGE